MKKGLIKESKESAISAFSANSLFAQARELPFQNRSQTPVASERKISDLVFQSYCW